MGRSGLLVGWGGSLSLRQTSWCNINPTSTRDKVFCRLALLGWWWLMLLHIQRVCILGMLSCTSGPCNKMLEGSCPSLPCHLPRFPPPNTHTALHGNQECSVFMNLLSFLSFNGVPFRFSLLKLFPYFCKHWGSTPYNHTDLVCSLLFFSFAHNPLATLHLSMF